MRSKNVLSKFKAYIWGGLAALVAVLVAVIRIVSARNSRLEREADTLQANLKRRQIVAEADIEIEKAETKIRERIKTDSVDAARKPDSLWDSADD